MKYKTQHTHLIYSFYLVCQETKVWIPHAEQVWIGGIITSDPTENKLDILLEDGRVNTLFI